MRMPDRVVSSSLLLASLVFLLPAIAQAGGGVNAPAAPRPGPARDIKVWTNDDVAALGARAESTTRPPAVEAAESETVAAEPETPAPLPPEKDPKWYAMQLDQLESELADVANEEEQLRQFRETSQGLSTGLNIAAPCRGITTDNRIAQLEARRAETERQIDALADTARVNGLPPGILVEGRGRVRVENELTPEEYREALVDRYRDVSDELAQTLNTIELIRAYGASRNIALLQPDLRWGGNLTTNMQRGLYSRESALAGEANSVEDAARKAGLAPAALH